MRTPNDRASLRVLVNQNTTDSVNQTLTEDQSSAIKAGRALMAESSGQALLKTVRQMMQTFFKRSSESRLPTEDVRIQMQAAAERARGRLEKVGQVKVELEAQREIRRRVAAG